MVMTYRRALLLVCTILTAAPSLANAAAPQRSTVPIATSSTTVTGMAGRTTTFELTRNTELGNGGMDVELATRSTAEALGLLLIRSDSKGHFQPYDVYLEYYGTDYGMCGQPHCPSLDPMFYPRAGVLQYDSAPAVKLRPGAYTAVLLGPASVAMTARIRFKNQPAGSTTLPARGAQFRQSVAMSPAVSNPGAQAVADEWMAASRNLFYAGSLFMIAADSPGVVHGNGVMSFNVTQPSDPPPASAAACPAAAEVNMDIAGAPQVVMPPMSPRYYYSAEADMFQYDRAGSQAAPPNWVCFGYQLSSTAAGLHHVAVAKFMVELPALATVRS